MQTKNPTLLPQMLQVMGVNLYPSEREYVTRIAQIYGLSLSAAIRWIINDHRLLKRQIEGAE